MELCLPTSKALVSIIWCISIHTQAKHHVIIPCSFCKKSCRLARAHPLRLAIATGFISLIKLTLIHNVTKPSSMLRCFTWERYNKLDNIRTYHSAEAVCLFRFETTQQVMLCKLSSLWVWCLWSLVLLHSVINLSWNWLHLLRVRCLQFDQYRWGLILIFPWCFCFQFDSFLH